MNFKELLSQAKDDDLQAKEPLLERYKSLLNRRAEASPPFSTIPETYSWWHFCSCC